MSKKVNEQQEYLKKTNPTHAEKEMVTYYIHHEVIEGISDLTHEIKRQLPLEKNVNFQILKSLS